MSDTPTVPVATPAPEEYVIAQLLIACRDLQLRLPRRIAFDDHEYLLRLYTDDLFDYHRWVDALDMQTQAPLVVGRSATYPGEISWQAIRTDWYGWTLQLSGGQNLPVLDAETAAAIAMATRDVDADRVIAMAAAVPAGTRPIPADAQWTHCEVCHAPATLYILRAGEEIVGAACVKHVDDVQALLQESGARA